VRPLILDLARSGVAFRLNSGRSFSLAWIIAFDAKRTVWALVARSTSYVLHRL
jgi:hypothetical protein